MSSDRRWTGGPANREWCSGTRAGRVIDPERIARDVRRYLRDCARFQDILSPKYHPTLSGCLTLVYHAGAEEKTAVSDEYQRQHTLREAS